jgi:hypothetical protein
MPTSYHSIEFSEVVRVTAARIYKPSPAKTRFLVVQRIFGKSRTDRCLKYEVVITMNINKQPTGM